MFPPWAQRWAYAGAPAKPGKCPQRTTQEPYMDRDTFNPADDSTPFPWSDDDAR